MRRGGAQLDEDAEALEWLWVGKQGNATLATQATINSAGSQSRYKLDQDPARTLNPEMSKPPSLRSGPSAQGSRTGDFDPLLSCCL